MEPPPARRIAGTAYLTDKNSHRGSLRVLKRATISGVIANGTVWCRTC